MLRIITTCPFIRWQCQNIFWIAVQSGKCALMFDRKYTHLHLYLSVCTLSSHWGNSKFTISSRSSRINLRPQKQIIVIITVIIINLKMVLRNNYYFIFSSDSFCLVISYWYSSFDGIRFIVYVRKKSRDCQWVVFTPWVLSFTTICYPQASNFIDLLLYLHTSSFEISIGNILESCHSTQHNNLWKFASTQKET